MLKWNKGKVQNLSPGEIWLFIIGRILAGFGAGILGMMYLPEIFSSLGLPALIIGMILIIVAFKGMFRQPKGN